ncbi:MAG: YjjG family noncanonical pyrimidine nucleotidase [Sphaerochaeta sp.]|uniref:YjjG family noncanonical pyrimidine nucleotidase n=1 Tax=Sphaerochaeta sp. TaxID=1972642 RepID=UPI002FC687CF
MYRYLFFDADGTLFDFDQAEKEAFFACAKDLGTTFDEPMFTLYQACNSACWQEFERGTLSLAELKTKRFAVFSNQSKVVLNPDQASRYYQAHLASQGILFPESREVLETLKQQGYILYLASNGISDVQRGRIEAAHIASYFSHIFISEELGYQKPDPRFFRTMLATANLEQEKSRCLMIGDSLSSDIKGGMASGIDTVWFNPGNKRIETSVSPTYTIQTLMQIMTLLSPNSSPI